MLQLLAPHLAARRGALSLRELVSSGELLPAELAAALAAALPEGCSILNLYGERGAMHSYCTDLTCTHNL